MTCIRIPEHDWLLHFITLVTSVTHSTLTKTCILPDPSADEHASSRPVHISGELPIRIRISICSKGRREVIFFFYTYSEFDPFNQVANQCTRWTTSALQTQQCSSFTLTARWVYKAGTCINCTWVFPLVLRPSVCRSVYFEDQRS